MSLHSLETAHLLDPLEYLAADVDTIAGRGVVQAVVVCLSFPLEHGGSAGENVVGDEILADYRDYNTCRSDVLLNAAVDNAVLGNVNRFA